eukprot:SAG22_NODE_9628_length_578_cov_1.722338_1_plen_41_part_01
MFLLHPHTYGRGGVGGAATANVVGDTFTNTGDIIHNGIVCQ